MNTWPVNSVIEALVLALAAVAPLWLCRRGGLIFDDYAVVDAPYVLVGDWKNALARIRRGDWRALASLTFAFGGKKRHRCREHGWAWIWLPWCAECREASRWLLLHHGVNAALWLCCVLLAWAGFGFAVAALYALSPLHPAFSAYMTGRAVLLGTVFGLAGCVLAPHWILPAVLLCLIAAMAKEDLALWLVPAAWTGGSWLPLAALAAGLLWKRRALLALARNTGSAGVTASGFPAHPGTPLYQVESAVLHFSALPRWLCGLWVPDWGRPAPTWIAVIAAWSGTVLIGFMPPFAILLLAVFWLPYILIPMPDMLAESRYPASALGLALAVESWTSGWMFAATCAAWGVAACIRAATFQNETLFWKSSLRLGGRRDRALANLANAADNAGDWDRAVELNDLCLAEFPHLTVSAANRAVLDAKRGDVHGAVRRMEEALAANPRFHQGWLALGNWRQQLGDHRAARAAYRESLKIDRYPLAMNRLGISELAANRFGLAAAWFREAHIAEPYIQDFRWNFGHALRAAGDNAGGDAVLASMPPVKHSAEMLVVEELK